MHSMVRSANSAKSTPPFEERQSLPTRLYQRAAHAGIQRQKIRCRGVAPLRSSQSHVAELSMPPSSRSPSGPRAPGASEHLWDVAFRRSYGFIFDDPSLVAKNMILAPLRHLVKFVWTMCEGRVAARQARFWGSGQGSHLRPWEQIAEGTWQVV